MGLGKMKTFILFFACACALAGDFSLDSIPDGYPAGRPQARYGAYGSVLHDPARPYDRMLDAVQTKVYGLAKLANESEIKQAELTYYLEHLLVGIYLRIANAPVESFTAFEREALLYRAARLYEDVRRQAERLYEAMIRIVDRELPGSTGAQMPTEIEGELEQLYTSNCRSEFCLSPPERLAFYQKKLKEFLDGGGSLTELHKLDWEYVKTLGPVTFLEYVVRPNHELWVTKGKAGHLLLAEGGDVLSAGQIVIIKDLSGNVSAAIATNASGNYKPDLYSADRIADRLSADFNLPEGRALVTKGEPLSTQTVRILMKAAKSNPDDVKAKAKELEKNALDLQANPEKYLPADSATSAGCAARLAATG